MGDLWGTGGLGRGEKPKIKQIVQKIGKVSAIS